MSIQNIRKPVALGIVALLLSVTACATPEKPQPWDKQGVRDRAGESGKKLGAEEAR